jgi:hypothetical protein
MTGDSAATLLRTARELVRRPALETAGLWPRAAALLGRQVLEAALQKLWAKRAPGLAECSGRAQLLCLRSYVDDDELAERAYETWGALSRALHHHPYELAPTAEELNAWLTTVEELTAAIARRTE